jgi:methionyl-tRNA synthetase
MAADLPVPEHVFVHGFLLSGGEKMSKSLGNVLDPFEVIERYGSDALRYYLLRDVSFGQDGSVSPAAFEERYERELANDYGNLASRTLAMIVRYRDGEVAPVRHDAALEVDFDGLAERVSELLDRAEVTQALEEIWQRVRRLNRYVEECAPWQLAKDPERAGDLDVVLATLAEGLRVLTVLLHPWLPATSAKLLAALGAPDDALEAARLGARRVARVAAIEPLFPKQAA